MHTLPTGCEPLYIFPEASLSYSEDILSWLLWLKEIIQIELFKTEL